MRTIHKFNLSDLGSQVELHIGAKVLHVGVQNNCVMIWVLHDLSQPKQTRRFITMGTGQTMEDSGVKHVGTVQDGPFVWHVFEVL